MDKATKILMTKLSNNSRIKISELKKEIFMSKQAIINKIKFLQKEDLIFPYTIINNFLIGNSNVHLHLKFNKINNKEIKEIISKLRKYEQIGWIAETFHNFDICISISYKIFIEVEIIVSTIKYIVKDKISQIHFSYIKENYYLGKIFDESITLRTIIKSSVLENKFKDSLNKTEKNILNIVSKNSRLKYTEISNKLDLTPNSIKYSLKELERKNFIKGYGLFINYLKLDFKWYQLILKTYLNNTRIIINELIKDNSVIFISETFEGNLIIDYICKNSLDVRNFLYKTEKIIENSSGYIIYEILNIHKMKILEFD